MYRPSACNLILIKVFYDPAPLGLTYAEIVTHAAELPNPIKLGGSRLVVHIQTSDEAVDDFLALIGDLASEKQRKGYVAPTKAELEESETTPFSNIYVRATKKN